MLQGKGLGKMLLMVELRLKFRLRLLVYSVLLLFNSSDGISRVNNSRFSSC